MCYKMPYLAMIKNP